MIAEDAWWFCTPPTVEEVRFRFDRATGQPIGAFLSCPHGSWTDLTLARQAHGYTVDVREPLPALPGAV